MQAVKEKFSKNQKVTFEKVWRTSDTEETEPSSTESWPKPTEKEFEQLARHDPNRLVRWIETGKLAPSSLTYAVEILGRIVTDSPTVVELLIKLTHHESPLVREGAVYGLAEHLDAPGVLPRLQDMAIKDLSPGVRDAVIEIISDDEEGEDASSDH